MICNMTRSQSSQFVILLLVTLVICFGFFSLRNNTLSHHEDLDDLISTVKRLSSVVKANDQHVENSQIQVSNKKDDESGFRITEYWEALTLIKWDFEKPPEYECRNKTPAGVYFICQDKPYTIKPPCITYSFGVYNKWAFEQTLGRMGCDTHSFDPSTKKGDHIHNKVVYFHNMGIGSEDTDSYKPKRDMYVKDDQIWKMRTLPSIMKMLGHEGKVIDALKVDVEGWEWFMLEQMLDTGIIHRVRQIIIEWHFIRDFPKKDTYIKLLRLYYRMKEAGFRTYYLNFPFRGYSKQRWRIQCDVMYVNTKFEQNL